MALLKQSHDGKNVWLPVSMRGANGSYLQLAFTAYMKFQQAFSLVTHRPNILVFIMC